MKQKDKTPTHIRLIRDPSKESDPLSNRESAIPVLTVSKSFLFWRKARIISIIVVSIVAIAAIGFSLRHYFVAFKTDRTVARALEYESDGTREKLETSSSLLADLVFRFGFSHR